MDTTKLRKFAQFARSTLIDQVAARLDSVLSDGSTAQREHPAAFKKLEALVAKIGTQQVIEKVAYIWFNRFTALRYMDVNGLSPVRVVSPSIGQFQPEILSDAKSGSINEQIVPDVTRQKVLSLLDGRIASPDPQGEAYRLLVVAVCNYWHEALPFMFERIDDFAELLMPSDLQSNASILAYLREAMAPDVCEDVEIIGWLYQFYISEKKDQVFAGLKKNQKIKAENIPAATQLFTPHWIVRYLVENSLGRLWLLNRPASNLAEQMDYYIAPEEPETDFLRISRPEDIRICDPAVGSGHMLTYAFDLLYAIYEEEGYDATKIPALILTHNLTGVEIDDRAGALAAFALAMKAAARLGRRRFLRMEAKPEICVLQNVSFTEAEMQDVAAVVGKDLFTDELRETLGQFEQAKNFGSLIVPKLRDPAETLRVVEARDFGGDLLLKEVQERVVAVLRMAEALSPKYHAVVANPPYMGGKGMNGHLSDWMKTSFPKSKSDLMTAFMERAQLLTRRDGIWGMINLPSWMYLGSYEALRLNLFGTCRLNSLLHLGRGVFGSDFGTVAFCITNSEPEEQTSGRYYKLFSKHVEVRPPSEIEQIFLSDEVKLFVKLQSDIAAIPGSPLVYDAGDGVFAAFKTFDSLGQLSHACSGLQTGDNFKYLRQWYEVGASDTYAGTAQPDEYRWQFHRKGGEFRKWYGNIDYVVDWQNNGSEIRASKSARPQNLDYWYREGVTWSHTSSGGFSARQLRAVDTFNVEGPSAFTENPEETLAFLCSKPAHHFMAILSPNLHFLVGTVSLLPIVRTNETPAASSILTIAKSDWDAYETSWDFATLPLLQPDHRAGTLEATYTTLRAHWQGMTDEMQRLEEENNRIFIDAYGLEDELTPEVPLNEITLTCNPAYRYGIKNDAKANEARLRADTMAEFLSYAVGCMFGRYSLEAPGLILANQGEKLADYLARVSEPSFMPDEDNVIPLLDENWFSDDITERFRLFLRVTFGEAHFRENLRYIEDSLGKDIRRYFTKDFYADHVKRYKKRPIYWMFSSPKGTFNALIYMHRYQSDTVSVLLNDYLREFITKLEGERARLDKLADDPTASQGQKTKALKDSGAVAKQIDELNEWEREVIFPLAQQKIEIDLDDGVKHNYPLFGSALKKIAGLS